MSTPEWQSRTELLIGKEKIQKLHKAHVLIAGLGGVGGYAAEQLCRAGIGKLSLVDNDTVHPSNRNRQIIALAENENILKTELLGKRLQQINPDIELNVIAEFLHDENIDTILSGKPDYIVDAIDTLTPKVNLIYKAFHKNIPVISSMGSGGRLNPANIKIDDISKSNHCKFAFYVRKYLHRKGIFKGIKVVYSSEPVPKNAFIETTGDDFKRSMVGTISYMPAIFGCYCAYAVIHDLTSSK